MSAGSAPEGGPPWPRQGWWFSMGTGQGLTSGATGTTGRHRSCAASCTRGRQGRSVRDFSGRGVTANLPGARPRSSGGSAGWMMPRSRQQRGRRSGRASCAPTPAPSSWRHRLPPETSAQIEVRPAPRKPGRLELVAVPFAAGPANGERALSPSEEVPTCPNYATASAASTSYADCAYPSGSRTGADPVPSGPPAASKPNSSATSSSLAFTSVTADSTGTTGGSHAAGTTTPVARPGSGLANAPSSLRKSVRGAKPRLTPVHLRKWLRGARPGRPAPATAVLVPAHNAREREGRRQRQGNGRGVAVSVTTRFWRSITPRAGRPGPGASARRREPVAGGGRGRLPSYHRRSRDGERSAGLAGSQWRQPSGSHQVHCMRPERQLGREAIHGRSLVRGSRTHHRVFRGPGGSAAAHRARPYRRSGPRGRLASTPIAALLLALRQSLARGRGDVRGSPAPVAWG